MTSYIQENNSVIEPVILNMYTANIAIIFELSIHSKQRFLLSQAHSHAFPKFYIFVNLHICFPPMSTSI